MIIYIKSHPQRIKYYEWRYKIFNRKIKAIRIQKENNNLLGPSGVKIELSNTTEKGFCIIKYSNNDYTGECIKWGDKKELDLKDALVVLLQIFIDIEW